MFEKNIYAKYFTNIPKIVPFSLLQGKNNQNLHDESEGSVYQTKNDTRFFVNCVLVYRPYKYLIWTRSKWFEWCLQLVISTLALSQFCIFCIWPFHFCLYKCDTVCICEVCHTGNLPLIKIIKLVSSNIYWSSYLTKSKNRVEELCCFVTQSLLVQLSEQFFCIYTEWQWQIYFVHCTCRNIFNTCVIRVFIMQ